MRLVSETLPLHLRQGSSAVLPSQPALALGCAPCSRLTTYFCVNGAIQVLEFDLRSSGGARALLVTSPAAVVDDGEVRRRILEARRIMSLFGTRNISSNAGCFIHRIYYFQASLTLADSYIRTQVHHHRVLRRPLSVNLSLWRLLPRWHAGTSSFRRLLASTAV